MYFQSSILNSSSFVAVAIAKELDLILKAIFFFKTKTRLLRGPRISIKSVELWKSLEQWMRLK